MKRKINLCLYLSLNALLVACSSIEKKPEMDSNSRKIASNWLSDGGGLSSPVDIIEKIIKSGMGGTYGNYYRDSFNAEDVKIQGEFEETIEDKNKGRLFKITKMSPEIMTELLADYNVYSTYKSRSATKFGAPVEDIPLSSMEITPNGTLILNKDSGVRSIDPEKRMIYFLKKNSSDKLTYQGFNCRSYFVYRPGEVFKCTTLKKRDELVHKITGFSRIRQFNASVRDERYGNFDYTPYEFGSTIDLKKLTRAVVMRAVECELDGVSRIQCDYNVESIRSLTIGQKYGLYERGEDKVTYSDFDDVKFYQQESYDSVVGVRLYDGNRNIYSVYIQVAKMYLDYEVLFNFATYETAQMEKK